MGIVGPTEIEDDPIVVSHYVLTQHVLPVGKSSLTTCVVHRTRVREAVMSTNQGLQPKDIIHMLELDFIERDNFQKISQEDMRFLKIMERGIHVNQDGHYEMPLPLKDSRANLPMNRTMAVKRLEQLRKKLERDPVYSHAYATFMQDMISKGYAEKVTQPDTANHGEVWYIPHHGVRHPKKPEKLRVVFDCSASFGGQSLNSRLLQGPDMTNKLVGVLVRFRQEPVALTCDVEAMFHQFSVCADQRDLLRFLWWENMDTSMPPTEYRMAVHLFGAVSSPACATFALRQIATDHEELFGSEAANFIRDDFYVDDGLKSVPDTQIAIALARQSRELCAQGELRLHKFSSNRKEVLQSIPQEDRAVNLSKLDLFSDELPSERVLGVHWDIAQDALSFQINLQEQPLTRRGILSTVSQVYDPIGMAAPVIFAGKHILQELCRENLQWDAPLPDEIFPRWEQWKSELHQLQALSVPRCYKPAEFGTIKSVELHHFSDASMKGYGCCSYLRLVNLKNEVHCTLVMGKARVTPLKSTTVPRLELTAAGTAVRVAQLLGKQMSYEQIQHHFWTDSRVVLGYINNEASRYHIFVANRVQLICDVTKTSQWRHVATKENPADLASRGCPASDLVQSRTGSRVQISYGNSNSPLVTSRMRCANTIQKYDDEPWQLASNKNLSWTG